MLNLNTSLCIIQSHPHLQQACTHERDARRASLLESAMLPSPSCPEVPFPQAQRDPFSAIASVWHFPAAMDTMRVSAMHCRGMLTSNERQWPRPSSPWLPMPHMKSSPRREIEAEWWLPPATTAGMVSSSQSGESWVMHARHPSSTGCVDAESKISYVQA